MRKTLDTTTSLLFVPNQLWVSSRLYVSAQESSSVGVSAHTIFVCAQNIPASDASKHLGEQETVCGRVAEVKITTSVRGSPTFIDFERPYPNETFTAVIWERDKRVLELFQESAYFASEGRSLSIMDGLESSFIAVPIGQERKQYLAITGTIRTLTGRPFIHPHILSVGFQRVRLLNVRMGRIASVSIGRGLVRIMGEWRSGFKPTFLGLRTQMQTGSKIENQITHLCEFRINVAG